MVKKSKIVLLSFLIIGIILFPLKKVDAHSVELDPESLIIMPSFIWGESASITINSSITDYTLYYQAVQVSDEDYAEINKTISDGEIELNTLKEEYTALKSEYQNLEEVYNSAYDAYAEGLENENLTEEEVEELKNAYETALANYKNKVSEYNNKIDEYNTKVDEINGKIKKLKPTYIEDNWIQTTDNKFSVDLSTFSGEKAFVVWAKLVTSSGIYYDEGLYTFNGNKVEDEEVTVPEKTETPDVTTPTTNTNINTSTTDSTVANKILPNTGVSGIIIFSIIIISVLGIFAYKKYKYLY